jgi:hypothetical protein
MRRVPPEVRVRWRANLVSFPPHCDPEVIQARISEKALSVADYRGHCDEIWLLVVARHMGTATWWSNVEAAARESFTSPFDRTYFLIQPAPLYLLETGRGLKFID